MTAAPITPFLSFDEDAEAAARFYVSVFRNSAIEDVLHYPADAPRPEGSVMTVTFTLRGQRFVALNGGPEFTFTPAISFMVACETQDEIDELWERLSDGGEALSCGWVRDRFGMTWQIVPSQLGDLLTGEHSERVLREVWAMDKIELARLQAVAV